MREHWFSTSFSSDGSLSLVVIVLIVKVLVVGVLVAQEDPPDRGGDAEPRVQHGVECDDGEDDGRADQDVHVAAMAEEAEAAAAVIDFCQRRRGRRGKSHQNSGTYELRTSLARYE